MPNGPRCGLPRARPRRCPARPRPRSRAGRPPERRPFRRRPPAGNAAVRDSALSAGRADVAVACSPRSLEDGDCGKTLPEPLVPCGCGLAPYLWTKALVSCGRGLADARAVFPGVAFPTGAGRAGADRGPPLRERPDVGEPPPSYRQSVSKLLRIVSAMSQTAPNGPALPATPRNGTPLRRPKSAGSSGKAAFSGALRRQAQRSPEGSVVHRRPPFSTGQGPSRCPAGRRAERGPFPSGHGAVSQPSKSRGDTLKRNRP